MERDIRPQMSKRLLLALVITVLIVPSMFAQVERTSSIQGTVKDPSGAVISSATVELTSTALFTGKAATSTDSSGYYRFDNLRPGSYNLTATKSGFTTYKLDGIDLAVGRAPTIDVTLKVGAASEIVEVTGQAPQIDVAQSKVQTNVTSDILADAPTGRSFQSVIQFAPGARAEPLQGGAADSGANRYLGLASATGANTAGSLGNQIDGAANAENSYMVEGQETANVQSGNSSFNVPMEFIQEVVIKSSGFEAEHGGAMSGIINVIEKRGSNEWHGSVFTSYQGDALNAAPNRTLRDNGGAEYTQPIKDHYRVWDPGFEVGGYLLKDKIWVFASSVPDLIRQQRTVFMTGKFPAPGPRTYSSNTDTYYSLARVDANPFSKLHIYGSWQYNYSKNQGYSQAAADSVFMVQATDPVTGALLPCVNTLGNQCNLGGASGNPDNFNAGIGYRAPNQLLGVGGDVTITPNLIFSSRFGRGYNAYKTLGTPVGIRYIIRNTTYSYSTSLGGATANTTGLDGTTLAAACPACVTAANFGTGYFNIGDNTGTAFDSYWRTSWSNDLSYFVKGWGTHNFKFGYLYNKLSNDVLTGYITANAYVSYMGNTTVNANGGATGTAWHSVVGSSLGCVPIAAFNLATWGSAGTGTATDAIANTCRGNFGTINFRELGTSGKVGSNTHAFYLQDNWNIGHGVTLNLGVRFDKETVPSYSSGFPGIDFSWGQKIAPRLGASWDVMRNGKLKIYGSFGSFYDIMKYDSPRGSFGGDYWHDCTYAMDNPNYLLFIPVRGADGHFCEPSGQLSSASTVPAGARFIQNDDFRIVSNDPNRACDANQATPGSCTASLLGLEPTLQREYVLGADWAITPQLAFEVRWARKRMVRAIEDTGVIGPGGEVYSINNPGEGFNAVMYGPGNPPIPKANRRYDGLEFRLTKAASAHWYGQASYTYSKLRGNYTGLTATDIADGGGGRQGSNTNRAFDEPMGSFDGHGNPIDGPLPTDRPHALKMLAYYRVKWWKMETTFGGFQQVSSGSPLTTYLDVFGMNTDVEGRGNWINMTADPVTGAFIPGSIIHGFRTPSFSQTDLNFTQEMHVSKNNERLRLGLEANIFNVFNQHSPTYYNSNLTKTGGIAPLSVDPAGATCTPVVIDPRCIVDYPYLLHVQYNYINELNGGPGNAAFEPSSGFNPLYGMPYGWQAGRSLRFKVKFTF
ncbi:MAG: TonB-dependent receptor [Acidobacteriia bacterium]|nr:TonB-dependent receptor [Terriglobia bacterium]